MFFYSHIFKLWGLGGLVLVLGLLATPGQARVPETPLEQTKSRPLKHERFVLAETVSSEGERSPQSVHSGLTIQSAAAEDIQHVSSALASDRQSPSSVAASAPGTDLLTESAVGTTQPALKTRSETSAAAAKPGVIKKEPKTVAPLLSEFLDRPTTAIAQPPEITPTAQSSPPPPAKPPTTAASTTSLPSDPELGVIQVAEVRRDDELGVIQLRNPLQDPELGILELQQIVLPPRRAPIVYFSSYVTGSSSDNVFLVDDPIQGRFGDTFMRPGISITAFPAVGPSTNLLLAARATLLRYEEQTASSYDELRFQAGVRHQFSDRVYGQFSVSHQLLYQEGFADQFFTNTGLELTVGRRDRLTPQLTLDSYYQGQVFLSDPERFSNVLNSVGTYLGYRITPEWDTGVGYRLTVSDFTQQSRHETYQRITGQLRYAITPAVRLSVFGGLSYGRSSESRISFDDTFFGISIDATVSIF